MAVESASAVGVSENFRVIWEGHDRGQAKNWGVPPSFGPSVATPLLRASIVTTVWQKS